MTIPPEQTPTPLVSISLDWFLNKFCRTVHNFAITSKEFGDYIRLTVDPQEQFTHVDYPEESPQFAHIYPKNAWIEAVKRMDKMKQASELARQERFAREEAIKILESRYKQREDTILRFLSILDVRFPAFVKDKSKKFKREMVLAWLQGKGKPEAAAKLGIDTSTVEEFLALPSPTIEEADLLNANNKS